MHGIPSSRSLRLAGMAVEMVEQSVAERVVGVFEQTHGSTTERYGWCRTTANESTPIATATIAVVA